jgi:UDP-glucose 4-epimerase
VRALVTGGAGFIGHHLVRSLAANGHVVAVLDNYTTGLKSRVQGFPADVKFVEGDVRNQQTLDDAIARCELVFHLAAVTSVEVSFQEPRLTCDVNEGGTIEVMHAAKRAGVRRVVFASSAAVYGLSPVVPTGEGQPVEPASPYATSKAAGERYLHDLGRALDIETVALRYFNIFGAGQHVASAYAAVIPQFINAGLHDRPITLNGDGLQTRDFTYVDDVVSANLRAASVAGVGGLTANIGSGHSHTLMELVEILGECLGRPLDVVYGPPRLGDPRHSLANIATAHESLGYEAQVSLQDGLQRMVKWCRENRDEFSTRPI